MNFGWVYPEDSGEYVCRATNLYGSDETRGFINTAGRPGIIYESQLPKGMASIERIREMESGWQRAPGEILKFCATLHNLFSQNSSRNLALIDAFCRFCEKDTYK